MAKKRKRPTPEDDERFFNTPLPGEGLPLVMEGEHEAVILVLKRGESYDKPGVNFTFKLLTHGPDFGVCLPGFGRFNDDGSIAKGGKLMRWRQIIAAFTGQSPSKVTLASFKGFWLKIRVKTVRKDQQQHPLHPSCHYSVVDNIMDVVGKISEVPPHAEQGRDQ
jgi:hypothetical protein